jgi:hypothetical protein
MDQPAPSTAVKNWVEPEQRIRFHNIRPGDQVRLLKGKEEEIKTKVVQEDGSVQKAWKIYTVKEIFYDQNCVGLEGFFVRNCME